jgi:hypothetical protein
MKKATLALNLAAVFLMGLSVNSFPVVRVVKANPYEAPVWTILSPKNNAVYNTESFNLSFRVVSKTVEYDLYYSLDSAISEVFLGGPTGQGKTLVNATLVSVTPREGAIKLKTFQYSSELPNLNDGQHNLTLYYGYTDNFDFRRELASATIIFYIDTSAPKITDLSVKNTDSGDRLLSFNVDAEANWVGYSLDNQANFTVTGDVFLNVLAGDSHTVTIYAEDKAGNMGASETLFFSIEKNPLALIIFVLVTVVVVGVGLVLLLYGIKRK